MEGRGLTQPQVGGNSLRIRMLTSLCRLLLLLSLFACGASAREFDLRRDTFAFSNDTALSYGIDEAGELQISRRAKPAAFSHRCFVLARGVMQFHQFARFEPRQPRLSREEYRKLVRRLCRIPVWSRGPAERIVFPGYRDLHEFSIAYEGLLKENLGAWVPSYLRVGNWRMVMGHPRAGQGAAARRLAAAVKRGELQAVYLARFPKMNHVVVIYDLEQRASGDVRFWVYDPNYPNARSWLDYKAGSRSFEFERRWYFPGGRVNVMRVFISPFH
jgi:hypothetical protein